jgi:hypothetical protein
VEPPKYSSPRFLNIDLEVKSRRSLRPLLEVWSFARVLDSVEGHEPRWLYFSGMWRGITAEATAKYLLRLIARLRGDALRCWKTAHLRVFDIGIRAPGQDAGRSFGDVKLSVETLRGIAAAGVRLDVSVYKAEIDDGVEYWPPKVSKRKASKRR